MFRCAFRLPSQAQLLSALCFLVRYSILSLVSLPHWEFPDDFSLPFFRALPANFFFSSFFHALPANLHAVSIVLSFYFPPPIFLMLLSFSCVFFAPLFSRFANSCPAGSIALGFPQEKLAPQSRSAPYELFPRLFFLLFFFF